jgi:hypothetical protein
MLFNLLAQKQLLVLLSVGSHAWSLNRLSISLFLKGMVTAVCVCLAVVLDTISYVRQIML